MSEKILLIAGGSDPSGSEIDGSEDSVYNRQNSFGGVLANKLGYRPINIALAGAANPGITRSIIEWFNQEHNPVDQVFVLVGWADSNRIEVPFNRPTWYNIWNPHCDWFDQTSVGYMRINMAYQGHGEEEKALIAEYHRFMVRNENYLEIQSANTILQLQYFLKLKGASHLFCNTQHMFTPNDPHLGWYIECIDKSSYIDYDKNEEAFYRKYAEMGYTNLKAKYHHHDEIPHRLYAEYLHEHIQKHNLLNIL